MLVLWCVNSGVEETEFLGEKNQNYAYLTPLANHSTEFLVLTPGEFQNVGKCQIHQKVLWVE